MIDGSFGEGGGQILRTTIGLSAVLRRPVEIVSIRAKRDNPGLRPQHVAAIKAVASVCDGYVENLEVGSSTVRFVPSKLRSTIFELDVGSAGSITLLLQSVILATALSSVEVELELKGGTDVKWSPSFEYFRNVVLPAFRLIGVEVNLELLKRGYYPNGGGAVKARIKGGAEIRSLELVSSTPVAPSVVSICSRLPRSVAERQLSAAVDYLIDQNIKVDRTRAVVEEAPSPGSSITIHSVSPSGPFLGADSLGEKGKLAEKVGREAAQLFVKEFQSGAPIDSHLADMLVGLLALASGESAYMTSAVTQHLTTNLYVSQLLTGCKFSVDHREDGNAIVKIWGVRGKS